ncbi:MAG: hydrogenase maturation protease [Planctomycetes bacterium]|nr:hydrogenase maturation protease [Planctomycetota bacterium]
MLEHCACETLVLGCGNELFGDDGFGRAVARRLRESPLLPQGVLALDAGTAVREVLFDVLLGPVRPRRVVVVDAVDLGREPGEVWCIEARDLPEVKLDDFSMHQVPTSNLLRELHELAGVEVTCVVGQVSAFPREVQPGLSAPMQDAVGRAAEMILNAELQIANCRLPIEEHGASGRSYLQSEIGDWKSEIPERS